MKMVRCSLLSKGEEGGMLEPMLKLAESVAATGQWKNDMGVGKQFQEQYAILRKIGS